MEAPSRSRRGDHAEPGPPSPPGRDPGPEGERHAPRSRLRDLVDAAPPAAPDDGRPGPKPGVPAYRTPVFVPAHPRSVAAAGAHGAPVRVPFVVFELFERPAHGTVAFAFTSPERLAQALGEAQPWVATALGPLAESTAERGITVLLDPRVAPGQHNWQPADLAAYAGETRG
ncbi:SAV_915 family protein [Streptomyces sp. NPDC046985]|uniref:SAV_915 family protein n=1 Tax=Streptomyces sp. NPDC046985 TaxID=3155377 RepID=UPI0033D515F0